MTTNVLTKQSNSKVLVASSASAYDAHVYIDVKSFDGWRVLVPPFVSKQALEDVDEESTRPVPTEWTFVLHRF